MSAWIQPYGLHKESEFNGPWSRLFKWSQFDQIAGVYRANLNGIMHRLQMLHINFEEPKVNLLSWTLTSVSHALTGWGSFRNFLRLPPFRGLFQVVKLTTFTFRVLRGASLSGGCRYPVDAKVHTCLIEHLQDAGESINHNLADFSQRAKRSPEDWKWSLVLGKPLEASFFSFYWGD